MEVEKQRLILSALAGSRDLTAMCSAIIQPSYFDPSLKKTVKFMVEYFDKYKDVPKLQTIRAETGAVLEELGEITRADVKFISEEVEQFCQERAVTEALVAGPELLKSGDFGMMVQVMKDAVSVSLQKDMGLDYFADPAERMRVQAESRAKISTGFPELDEAIGGGVSRQELLLFAANSGGGKSMTMLNVGKNFLAQGLNGVYISLEMAEDTVSKRLDSMITHIGQDALLKEITKAANLISKAGGTYGKFIVKRMPENRTNVHTITSYLQQLEQTAGFRPDFIIIDYIDIMGTTMKISYDNLFIKDKYVTEEVRSLGFDFDAIILSASQLGRGAIDADKLTQAHIQGGISKINTADYTIAIKQTDVMRAAGELNFEILKSRNSGGTGKVLYLGWDPISLNILSRAKLAGELTMKKKSNSSTILGTDGIAHGAGSANGVLGLMNT